MRCRRYNILQLEPLNKGHVETRNIVLYREMNFDCPLSEVQLYIDYYACMSVVWKE